MEEPSLRIAAMIRAIPKGRVASYGQIAALAGIPHGARQVARLLHSSSDTRRLPWHRVLNAQGRISLPRGGGAELQRKLLEKEGVAFRRGAVDLERHGWRPVLRSPYSATARPVRQERAEARHISRAPMDSSSGTLSNGLPESRQRAK